LAQTSAIASSIRAARVPDFEAHEAKNARLSAELRPRLAGHLDLAYGEMPLQ